MPPPAAPSAPPPTSPSSVLRLAETTLHGLLFGEHDGGAQRFSLSSSICAILHSWAVGLLLADHGSSELSATAAALSALLRSRVAPTVDWAQLKPPDADVIAAYYWKHAAATLIRQHDPEEELHDAPLHIACGHLAAARNLLTLAASAPSRRSGAANQSPGELIFASLCLEFSPSADDSARREAEASLEFLQAMRRCASRAELIVGAFLPTLRAALLRAKDGVRPQELRGQGVATVADVVAHVAQSFAGHRRLLPSIPGLLDVILPLAEDVDTESRVIALAALEALLFALSPSELREHAPRLAPCLRGALIWHDGATGMPATRLLRVVLPLLLPGPPTLADDPPREWTEGLGQLMRAVELLLDQAARGEGEAEKKDCMHASVEIAETVPFVAQARLLRHAEKWVPAAAEVMQRVARMVGGGTAEVGLFERAAEAVVEAMRWTWMVEAVYRVDVFEACMCAVLEAKVCEEKERVAIRKAALPVLVCLADCSKEDTVLKLIDLMRVQTSKYRSLTAADEFFVEARGLLTADARIQEQAKGKPLFVGRFVQRFFPEIT